MVRAASENRAALGAVGAEPANAGPAGLQTTLECLPTSTTSQSNFGAVLAGALGTAAGCFNKMLKTDMFTPSSYFP